MAQGDRRGKKQPQRVTSPGQMLQDYFGNWEDRAVRRAQASGVLPSAVAPPAARSGPTAVDMRAAWDAAQQEAMAAAVPDVARVSSKQVTAPRQRSKTELLREKLLGQTNAEFKTYLGTKADPVGVEDQIMGDVANSINADFASAMSQAAQIGEPDARAAAEMAARGQRMQRLQTLIGGADTALMWRQLYGGGE